MAVAAANQLDQWLEQLAAIEGDAHQLLDGLSDAQLGWKPAPERWSIAECVEHLVITTGLTLRNAGPALERGRAERIQGEPPFRFGWLGGWFVRMMETPGRRPMLSPVNFVPKGNLPARELRERFFATQQELRRMLEAARGVALDRLKAGSSAKGAGWLRLNLAAWFAATLAHERRHLAQARRVAESSGFPG